MNPIRLIICAIALAAAAALASAATLRLLTSADVRPTGDLQDVAAGQLIRFQVAAEVSADNQGLASVVFRVYSPELEAAQFFFEPVLPALTGWKNFTTPPVLVDLRTTQYATTAATLPEPLYNGGWGFTNSGFPVGGDVSNPGWIIAAGAQVPLTWGADVSPNIPGFQHQARIGVGQGPYALSSEDGMFPGMPGGFGQDLMNGRPGDGSWLMFDGYIDTRPLPKGTYNVMVFPTQGSVLRPDIDLNMDYGDAGYRQVLAPEDLSGDAFSFTITRECVDCNENLLCDPDEIADMISPDCNGNVVPDECDLEDGTSADCDGNFIPDECQPDTDMDGRIDVCDNCPAVPNPAQDDLDGDDLGDACDPDADGDGYDGESVGGDDCDDLDPLVNPGAVEVCDNGIDDDCDDLIDAADPSCGTDCLCVDLTKDGLIGLPDFSLFAVCFGAAGQGPGCPPEQFECADFNADGFVNSLDFLTMSTLFGLPAEGNPPWCFDVDMDGFNSLRVGGADCDDHNPLVNPARPENCANGIDDNCDDLVDAADPQCQ